VYRDNKLLDDGLPMNFVLNHGALGDVITSLPAIIVARRENPFTEMRVWAPPWQMDLLAHLLKPYGNFEIKDFKTFPMKKAERENWDGGHVALNQMPFNTHTRNRVHMVDYTFGCLLDSRPESMYERNYPTRAPLGLQSIALLGSAPGYVVFPVGATSENKLFRASVMAPVIEWADDQGYLPVLVGTKASHTQAESAGTLTPIVIIDEVAKLPATTRGKCLDMREKTTLLGLRDLCGYASAVVGVDGGTLHLAGTTDTNIIYAMGATLPKHRYVARRGDPHYKIRYVGPRNLECTGCQSNWRMSRQDFRFCAYGDSACMERLHPDDFIEGLKELGL